MKLLTFLLLVCGAQSPFQPLLVGFDVNEQGMATVNCCFGAWLDGEIVNPSVESNQDTIVFKCIIEGCSLANIVIPLEHSFQFNGSYTSGIKLVVEYNNENNPDCDPDYLPAYSSETYYSPAAIDSMFLSTPVVDHSLLDFELSPNPTKNKFRVIFQKDVGLNEVILFSSQGQKMLQRKIRPSSSTMELDVSGFATGIYFVQVLDDKGYSRVEKLVVGH